MAQSFSVAYPLIFKSKTLSKWSEKPSVFNLLSFYKDLKLVPCICLVIVPPSLVPDVV